MKSIIMILRCSLSSAFHTRSIRSRMMLSSGAWRVLTSSPSPTTPHAQQPLTTTPLDHQVRTSRFQPQHGQRRPHEGRSTHQRRREGRDHRHLHAEHHCTLSKTLWIEVGGPKTQIARVRAGATAQPRPLWAGRATVHSECFSSTRSALPGYQYRYSACAVVLGVHCDRRTGFFEHISTTSGANCPKNRKKPRSFEPHCIILTHQSNHTGCGRRRYKIRMRLCCIEFQCIFW